MLAGGGEMNVIVSDQVRDGNVPAQQEPLEAARRAFRSLPESVTDFFFRGDSACYEKNLIGWLRNEHREGGPHGPVGFAISVRLHPSLKQHILRLPASAWKPYREDDEPVSHSAPLLNHWPQPHEEKEFGPPPP